MNNNQFSCFIIQQFSEDYKSIYNKIIRPTLKKQNFKSIRIDECFTQEKIIDEIQDKIKKASIVLIDISEDNPNVWWELVYTMALNKLRILICRDDHKRNKLPFDINQYQVIFYNIKKPKELKIKLIEQSNSLIKKINNISNEDDLCKKEIDILNFILNEPNTLNIDNLNLSLFNRIELNEILNSLYNKNLIEIDDEKRLIQITKTGIKIFFNFYKRFYFDYSDNKNIIINLFPQ